MAGLTFRRGAAAAPCFEGGRDRRGPRESSAQSRPSCASSRRAVSLAQCTDIEGLDEKLTTGKVSAYLGFDATADSLHVGSLLQIMILRLLQKHDHRPVVLVGGGTTKVGDPSGKDESRQLLDEATIQANIDGISSVFDKFIEFGADKAILVNNADWLDSLGYVEFLRTVGAQVTVNRMLSFESVKQRLGREQPLSFLEFNYMLLQAYDFLELYRREGVELQLGGSDQWGNIVSGVELTRRVEQGKVIGLTAASYRPLMGERWARRPPGRCGSRRTNSRPSTTGSSGGIVRTPT